MGALLLHFACVCLGVCVCKLLRWERIKDHAIKSYSNRVAARV